MPGPPHRSRRPAVRSFALPSFAAGLVAVALCLGGCGGGDDASEGGGDDGPVAERIGRTVADADAVPGVTAEMQVCVGERFLEDWDEDTALEVAEKAGGDVDGLSADEEAVVVEALDRCIDGTAFAEAYLGALYSELSLAGEPDGAAVDCVAEVVDGRVGSVAQGMDSGAPPSDFLAETDPCIPREVVDELLATTLAAPLEGGVRLTPDQVDCMVEQLSGTVTFGQLASGSEEASGAVRAALLQCPPA